MEKKVLIVEDDPGILVNLKDEFESFGCTVFSAEDGVKGLTLAREKKPDLIILDLMLPGKDGYEVCRELRSEGSKTPIIMLTARTQEIDKVLGLELGADDYVTKPFSLSELIARVRAALRRSNYPYTENLLVRVDERLIIDRARCLAIVDDQRVELSPTEYRILSCFLDNAGRVLTHQSLLTQVWGWEYVEETNYVKVYIHHLRQKIEQDPRNPRYIVTERGLGYRFQTNGGLSPS